MFSSQKEYMGYVKDISHKHSPAAGMLMELAAGYIDNAIKAEEDGKNVVWEASALDAPLIYACGAVPASYIELARFGTQEDAAYAENKLQIPGDVCSMAKVMLGKFSRTDKEKISLIHVNTSVCEPFNLTFEILKENGYPVLYQDTPISVAQGQYSEEYIADLKKRKMQDVYELSNRIRGQPVSEKRLKEEEIRYNRTLKKVNKINGLRKKHRAYLGNLASSYTMMGIGNYFGKPDEYEEVLDLLIAELEGLGDGEWDKDVVPLVWSGARSVDFGICHSLDMAGGIIFDWNVPTGLHQYFDEDLPAIDAWIQYSLGNYKEGKSGMNAQTLEGMIKNAGAKGVIFYNYMGCPMCAVNTYLTGGYVKQALNIPYLSLFGSFPTEAPSGQLITRLEAFVEMLR